MTDSQNSPHRFGGQRMRRRRAYLDDFQKTATGEWIYTGKTYSWKADRKKNLPLLWIRSSVALAAAIVAGCIPGVGMDGRGWVLLPYAVGLVASVTAIWAVGRLSFAGDPVRSYIYKATVQQLNPRAMVATIFFGATAACEVVNICLPGFTGWRPLAAVFVVLEVLGFLMSLMLRKLIRSLEWQENPPISIRQMD